MHTAIGWRTGFEGEQYALDVCWITASQSGYHWSGNFRRNTANGLEFAGRGSGKTSFKNIDIQVSQGLGNFDFFYRRHRRARRLLAVAQRGVRYLYLTTFGIVIRFHKTARSEEH